jgi:uncharacterized protein YndB with AHSA1/START domain
MPVSRISLTGAATLAACLAMSPVAASAKVVDQQANGFSLQESERIAAPPDKVFAELIQPSKWWSSAHTFSGDAKNLTLDAKAGGCWCETVPGGGSALHMTVVAVLPGKLLRLRGALGPFQSTGMDGAMNFVLAADKNGGTRVELVYNLGGYAWGGYQHLPESADGVLGLQLFRLKQLIETGSPDTPRPPEPAAKTPPTTEKKS